MMTEMNYLKAGEYLIPTFSFRTAKRNPREVWEHEENIPQGTQTDDLRRYDSERDIVSAPWEVQETATKRIELLMKAFLRRIRHRTRKHSRCCGAAHEQPKSTGRRNRTDGAGVQLTLDLFLSQDEQIKFIDEAENEVKTSFAFSFEQMKQTCSCNLEAILTMPE